MKPLIIMPGAHAPNVRDLVRCARCGNAYTVTGTVHGSEDPSEITLVHVEMLPGMHPPEIETSWCPKCAGADERKRGTNWARLNPPNEVADIEERLKLLRAASRPSEPLEDLQTVPAAWRSEHHVQTTPHPSAQGHILSAITQLERRRAELLGKVSR